MTRGASALSLFQRVDRRTLAAAGVRVTLLLLAVILGAVNDTLYDAAGWMVGLAAVGTLAVVAQRGPRSVLSLLLIGEVGVAAGGVVATAGAESPLLVYLPAVTFAAGLQVGRVLPVLAAGVAALILLGGRLLDVVEAREYTETAAEWTVISLIIGVAGTWIGGLLAHEAEIEQRDPYLVAYSLLDQLRGVAEGLPGSLDPGATSHALLERCITFSGAERGAVFLRFGGNRLVPMALHGFRRVPWRPSLSAPGPMRRLWESTEPLVERRDPDEHGRRRGSTLVGLPIETRTQRIGAVLLDWQSTTAVDRQLITDLVEIVTASALPLGTAILFDELRMTAANEERERLAREMHDGIAQDLAYLGYELDALAAVIKRDEPKVALDQAKQLRSTLTELVSQLRLSISDLRSSVGPARGLGAALSHYARSIGTNSGITVNLSLNEASTRLASEVETELLRIAHAALGSARRRRGVTALSVTLQVEPPAATLVIEDDGENTSYGDEKIAQRAKAIGAALEIREREPIGTTVRVSLGGE